MSSITHWNIISQKIAINAMVEPSVLDTESEKVYYPIGVI